MGQAESVCRRLLNVGEVAEYLHSTPGTIYQWVSQRRIPFVKMGRSTRFDLKAIDEWIGNNSRKPLEING